MNIQCGDKYVKKKTAAGQIVEAEVITTNPEDEYLIQLLNKKTGEKFFRHVEVLQRHWYNMRIGVQLKMFRQ